MVSGKLRTGAVSYTHLAKAEDEKTGRTMEVYTDLPGVQFYTANSLKTERGKNHAVYTPRCGYCFETQYFPDAINKPEFASPVIKAGEEYKLSLRHI